MWLIVGLGNPGKQYEKTRHNIGFMLTDHLIGSSSYQSGFKGLYAQTKINNENCILLKPQTYMNLSGESVQPLLAFYKIPHENLIVVQDDIDQPFGAMRFHKNRGHGGHNGIKSITQSLATMDYIRLKMGVGRPAHPEFPVADYVLQAFSSDEQNQLKQFNQKATDAIECLIRDGINKASTLYNK